VWLLCPTCRDVAKLLSKSYSEQLDTFNYFFLPGFSAYSIRFIHAVYSLVFRVMAPMAASEAVLLHSKASFLHLIKAFSCQVGLSHTRKFYMKLSLKSPLFSLNSSFLNTCYSFQISFKKSKNLNWEKPWRYFCPSPSHGAIQRSCRFDIQCNPSRPE